MRRNAEGGEVTTFAKILNRYKLLDCSLQGILAGSRSKSDSAGALAWFALRWDSRCATVLVAPSYCPSVRVLGLRGTPGDVDVDGRVQVAVYG